MFTKATIVAVALASSVLAGPCVRNYTIKGGDTCDSISAAMSVSTYQLAKINEGYINSACSNLQIGATFCIGYENEDCSKTYVVKGQDTCLGIANAHGLNTTMLNLNNPQIDGECSNIYVGEVLCVSDAVQVPPHSGPVTVATAIPVTATAAQSAAPHATAANDHSEDNNNNDDDDDDLPFCDEL
ncbi:hypothetical protein D9758_005810 [Tetrapyrgos nigripes]|uniref:LysM domain-containing protein n=1 Tax=Tetrapyrgos nigripes TaxID=182062 RepID=A0A8H5GK12_9AGAR|nr:hypothetical protein D9758_005810 [Tetrapyrgos nigripes]